MKKSIDGKIVDLTAEEQAEYDARHAAYNSDERKLKDIKKNRLRKLRQTDWWVLRGSMSEAQSSWRQALRDIPENYTTTEQYDSLLERDKDKDSITNGKLTHEIWSKP